MGFRSEMKKRALSLSQQAMERLMADEKRAMRVAEALGRVQRGKRALERGQEQLLRALSFATQGDFKAVGKGLSSLKRRARELEQKIGQMAERRAKGD